MSVIFRFKSGKAQARFIGNDSLDNLDESALLVDY